MIYCIERKYRDYSVPLFGKPFNWDTRFDSGRKRIVMKYLGKFELAHMAYYLYIDLASGGYFQLNLKVEESTYDIIWRIE